MRVASKIKPVNDADFKIADAEDIAIGNSDINTAITNNTNKIRGFITPSMFKKDNEKDDTQMLQRAIDYAITNNIQLKSDKTNYLISETLNITNFINIDFLNAKITATTDDTMIYINYPKPVVKGGYGAIENIVLDANNKNCNAIYCDFIAKTTFKGIKIFNLKEKGIKIGKDGTGYEVICDNIDINASGNNSVGIEILTGDCHFQNIIMYGCNIAIRNSGSNLYDKVHAWLFDNIDNSIFFDHISGDSFLSNCCSDTYYIDFKRHENSRLCIDLFKSILNSDLYYLDTKYFFYVDKDNFINKKIDILQASRYIIIGNSLLKGDGDKKCYLSNLSSDEFISKNLMNDNDFHAVVGIETAGVSKLLLDGDITDNFSSSYNKLIRRGNRILCEGKVQLKNTEGLTGAIEKIIGNFPEGYKPSYQKQVSLLITDTEWGNNGCGVAFGNIGGQLSFKYNCTNNIYPVFISYSFEYELDFAK